MFFSKFSKIAITNDLPLSVEAFRSMNSDEICKNRWIVTYSSKSCDPTPLNSMFWQFFFSPKNLLISHRTNSKGPIWNSQKKKGRRRKKRHIAQIIMQASKIYSKRLTYKWCFIFVSGFNSASCNPRYLLQIFLVKNGVGWRPTASNLT